MLVPKSVPVRWLGDPALSKYWYLSAWLPVLWAQLRKIRNDLRYAVNLSHSSSVSAMLPIRSICHHVSLSSLLLSRYRLSPPFGGPSHEHATTALAASTTGSRLSAGSNGDSLRLASSWQPLALANFPIQLRGTASCGPLRLALGLLVRDTSRADGRQRNVLLLCGLHAAGL